MRILAISVVVGLVTIAAGRARAQPGDQVALLPLDAEARLEIYGQPVASYLAEALRAGSLVVVVVGPKAGVPGDARLIVDGTIAAGKGSAVVLSIRIRNPIDGTVLDKLDTTAPKLSDIDKAAADLSARVVPVVRERLAALKRTPPVTSQPGEPLDPGAPRRQLLPRDLDPSRRGLAARPVLVGVGVAATSSRELEPFRAVLAGVVDRWARAAIREPRTVDAATLTARLAPATVATAKADGAIAFEVMSFSISTHAETRGGRRVEVPLARARVRVRVADPGRVMFDRVIVTDTVVGERDMAVDALATRTADEVLAILRPHMRRMVTAWP